MCDLANELKNDDWHAYAANAAAAFVAGLIRDRSISPLEAKPRPGKTAPLLVMRAQSLRPIDPDDVLSALGDELKGRDIETQALEFMDLVQADALVNPEEAASRLTDPQGVLFDALARRGELELVFHGLVHIPLACLAGHLITDRQRVRLFDYHPTVDSGSWAWPDDGNEFPPILVRGLPTGIVHRTGEAVVRVSVSYEVNPANTRTAVPDAAVEIDMTVSTPERGVVRSEQQTRSYGREFRRVIDQVAQRMRGCRRIHLFYAGPVALAFHLGQQISANIHPPVTVWNFRRGVYEWGLDLAAASQGEKGVVRATDEEGSTEILSEEMAGGIHD